MQKHEARTFSTKERGMACCDTTRRSTTKKTPVVPPHDHKNSVLKAWRCPQSMEMQHLPQVQSTRGVGYTKRGLHQYRAFKHETTGTGTSQRDHRHPHGHTQFQKGCHGGRAPTLALVFSSSAKAPVPPIFLNFLLSLACRTSRKDK